MRGSALHGLKLRKDHRQFVRGMLHVEQDPVEAGAREDFSNEMTRQAVPEAKLQLAVLQCLFEGVMEFVHWGSLAIEGLVSPLSVRPSLSYTGGRSRASRSTAPAPLLTGT